MIRRFIFIVILACFSVLAISEEVDFEQKLLSLELPFSKTTKADDLPTIKNRKYVVVIDAGSSGSRAMVYSWYVDNSESARSKLPTVEKGNGNNPEWTFKVKPGISSMEKNITAIGPYLKPLLDFAASIIPKENHGSTDIYLFATAGMRLLVPSVRNDILQRACDVVRAEYSFAPITSCESLFRVISGELEGIFGWIAINYLKKAFDYPFGPNHSSPKTFGFLDMGGASAQIAFQPDNLMASKHSDDLTQVHLRSVDGYSSTYNLSVSTYLGYGVNQARDRFIRYLASTTDKDIQKSSTEKVLEIEDPCSLKDTSKVTKLAPDRSHVDEVNIDNDFIDTNVIVKGTGHYQLCTDSLKKLLHKEKACKDLPCTFNGVHIPLSLSEEPHQFIGISEYWFTLQGIAHDLKQYSEEQVQNLAKKFCSLSFNEAKAKYEGLLEEGELESLCFRTAWIQNILHEGFNIPKTNIPGETSSFFEAVDIINGFLISWTLGAVIILISSTIHPPGVDERLHYNYLLWILMALVVFMMFKVRNTKNWKHLYRSLFRKRNSILDEDDNLFKSSSFSLNVFKDSTSYLPVNTSGMESNDDSIQRPVQVTGSGNYYISGRK